MLKCFKTTYVIGCAARAILDLYEQSFADGVDFLKGIPPQRGLPCSGPQHCLWLPSFCDSYYLGTDTYQEFAPWNVEFLLSNNNVLYMFACCDSRHISHMYVKFTIRFPVFFSYSLYFYYTVPLFNRLMHPSIFFHFGVLIYSIVFFSGVLLNYM